ncbi:MAG: hypothetical protein V1742_05315, partial [Pseudomonadota bacterium]
MMGREIKRVPPGWEHPRDDSGHYIPLHDETYREAADDWLQKLMDWEADKGGERSRMTKKYGLRYYWDWDGPPPDKEGHRPVFTTEPTCYQIYETVSEGTPTSPVF